MRTSKGTISSKIPQTHIPFQRLRPMIVTSVAVTVTLLGCSSDGSEKRAEQRFDEIGIPVPTVSDVPNPLGTTLSGGDVALDLDSSDVGSNSSGGSSTQPSRVNDSSDSSAPTTIPASGASGETTGSDGSAPSSATTTPPRPNSGGLPPVPSPIIGQPPQSPPLIGPQTTTTIAFVGPTVPPAPTTTIDTGPFRCTVQLAWNTATSPRQLNVSVLGANRDRAWVVLNWPDLPIRFGLDLVNGEGSRSITSNETTFPAARVFTDPVERPADLGCQQV